MRLLKKDTPKKTKSPHDGIEFRSTAEARRVMMAHLGCGCEACGWKPPKPGPAISFPESSIHLHHITPRRRGGPDAWGNLALLCPTCHVLADNIQVDWSGGHRSRFLTVIQLIVDYPVSWGEKLLAMGRVTNAESQRVSSESSSGAADVLLGANADSINGG